MLRLSIVGLIAASACGAPAGSQKPPPPAEAQPGLAGSRVPRPSPSGSAPAAIASPTTSAPASAPPKPIPQERFEPAHRYVDKTKLSLYSYHTDRIGNVEGYTAPILLTSDGGFLVVGTRTDYPAGHYQIGKSRPVVAKLDAGGALSWERSYRASGFLDFEGASAVELDDGYVVYVLSYVHPARGGVVRLLRLDRKGTVVWDLRLRGQGRDNTPFAQNVRLQQGQLSLDGHIYKDSSDTAYGWKGTVSLDGKVQSDEVGAANPYEK